MTTRVCSMCGSEFEPNTVGRPSIYCGKECRDAASALWLLQSRLTSIQQRATDAKWKALRGELWRLSNLRGVNDISGARRTLAARRDLVEAALEPWGGQLLRLTWSTNGVVALCRLASGAEVDIAETASSCRFTSERLRLDALLDALIVQIHHIAKQERA